MDLQEDMNLEHRLSDSDQTREPQIALSAGSKIQGGVDPLGFIKDEFVVYPAHGVGQILAIEVQVVAGASLEFFVVYFAKSKMRARVPTHKAAGIGIRKLSSPAVIEQVRRTLSKTAPRARMHWSRLTKEYESKIKSGDVIALAEVMRDLHRRNAASEQSYSQWQFYLAALDRLSDEIALVERVTVEAAVLELESLLKAKTLGGRKSV